MAGERPAHICLWIARKKKRSALSGLSQEWVTVCIMCSMAAKTGMSKSAKRRFFLSLLAGQNMSGKATQARAPATTVIVHRGTSPMKVSTIIVATTRQSHHEQTPMSFHIRPSCGLPGPRQRIFVILLYFVVPRVILFRIEHTPRTLVRKVDFISAPGTSPPGVYRPGGPYALVTGRCVFRFDAARGRFRLASMHPGHDLDEVRAATGFDFDSAEDPPITPAPSAETMALIRGPVGAALAGVYPRFTAALLDGDRAT